MNDDAIIASGLLKIKDGITSGNWAIVCEGYKDISGEDIKLPEKQVSRLDNIRNLMKDNSSIRKIKDIKNELISSGYNENDLKNKGRKELLSLLSAKQEKTPEPNVSEIIIQKQQGGKNFGRGELQIITDQYNETEALENAKTKRPRMRIESRKAPPVDNSKDDSATFRFHNENKKPPLN